MTYLNLGIGMGEMRPSKPVVCVALMTDGTLFSQDNFGSVH